MEKLVKVAPDLKWRTDYNFKTDDLFKAPFIANDILKLADGNHTVDEIINYLFKENKVTQSDANRYKLIEYINDLIQRDILFIVN